MPEITRPTKEQVRQYLTQRRLERSLPPGPAEIRARLGWRLTPGADGAAASTAAIALYHVRHK
jgi:hypothetical protein